jgi:3-oxoadipate enol-lactonase
MSVHRPSIILVPSFGGSSELLEPLRDCLEASFRTFAVEPPGFGRAEPLSGFPSTRKLAQSALDRWPVVGDATSDVFGISLGGMIAQWMAVLGGPRVRGLVIASAPARGFDALRGLPWRNLGECILEDDDRALACLTATVIADTDRSARAFAAKVSRAHPRSKRDLLWLGAAAARHDARHVLAGVTSPTLVLSGGIDPIVPVEVQAELVERVPNARQEIVPDAGHDLALEAPDETAQAIVKFAEGL